jgi:hypothetical protein
MGFAASRNGVPYSLPVQEFCREESEPYVERLRDQWRDDPDRLTWAEAWIEWDGTHFGSRLLRDNADDFLDATVQDMFVDALNALLDREPQRIGKRRYERDIALTYRVLRRLRFDEWRELADETLGADVRGLLGP